MDKGLDFQFGVMSDLHVGLPHTIQDHPTRFHLVEWSIPALEEVLAHLQTLSLDFLLIPGDLTQHGEPDNHQWLAQRLQQLPFPTYVIPGNHDIPVLEADGTSIAAQEFASYYQGFGYDHLNPLDYYHQPLLPGVRLIGLNSNQFNAQGQQVGMLTAQQLHWLDQTLTDHHQELMLVMIHHNILEHFPQQTVHPIGRRYMLKNAEALRPILKRHGVQLIFTGHLHVQDIIAQDGLVDITTGSLVSYPHPYRTVRIHAPEGQQLVADIQSFRVESLDECAHVQDYSRQWMGDRSKAFMMRMLTEAPLNLPEVEAKRLVPRLKYFWATIAQGDPQFDLEGLPTVLQTYLQTYENYQRDSCDLGLRDNHTRIPIQIKMPTSV